MAQGWLGWLSAMKPVLESVYGSAENVDNIIAQIRNDYVNPNYHGYNFMYVSSVGVANKIVIVLLGGDRFVRRHDYLFWVQFEDSIMGVR